MSPKVRTVLGDIDPGELGVCDSHDHLFIRSPMFAGQELDDVDAALGELTAFAARGGNAVVQWTPWGMGPRTEELPELSRQSGVHIISATGMHQAKHYDPDELARVYDNLAEVFVADVTTAPVKAGMIKIAGAFHHLDDHARHVAAAASEAHHPTGAPIGVHLEGGTAALDIVDVLCGEHDVPPNRVILGHLHRFPDSAVHLRAADAGAFLAFDGPSRAHHYVDWKLLELIKTVVDAGYTDRILLGGDTVLSSARSTADGPGMPYLLRTLRPRIVRELGDDVATAIFVDNPARAFAVEW